MDGGVIQGFRAAVGELVRYPRGDQDDVAWTGLNDCIAHLVGAAPAVDDEQLFVVVPMERGPKPRRTLAHHERQVAQAEARAFAPFPEPKDGRMRRRPAGVAVVESRGDAVNLLRVGCAWPCCLAGGAPRRETGALARFLRGWLGHSTSQVTA